MRRLPLFFFFSALPLAASAQLYSENFDVDHTSSWTFNSSVGSDTRNNNSNGEANFFFDYSVAGIPSAPHSGGTTTGLKLEANVFGSTGPIFSGISVSPNGQSFSGNYTLTFDAWQNFQGPMPGGGNGTTQAFMGGIGSATTTAQFPGGTFNGVGFAATPDGGSAQDYRAYTAGGAPLAETSGVYAAGNTTGVTNNSNAYYSSFKGSVPAAQTTYAAGLGLATHTGDTAAGALGMKWHSWKIEKLGTTVTWSVDGKLLATVSNANPAGSNIFLGYFDTNGTASNQAFSRQLLFGLVDNVRVDAVPEPGTMAVLGLGVAALARRRKKV